MPWTTAILTATELPDAPVGTTTTVDECFTTYIKPYLPKRDVVEHWHKLLLEYVVQPQAILFVRRYASYAKKQRDTLRRGFLTLDTQGFGYAYCDNSIAQLIFAQALAGRKPSLSELNAAIADRSFPVSTILSRLERQQMTFGLAASPQLGRRRWKLSHLYPVNSGYNFDYRSVCQQLFPRGNYAWWSTADRIYRLNDSISTSDRERMVAHFLRTVHPANYFLTPGRRHQAGGDVGENTTLLAYVRKQLQQRYGTVLAELQGPFLIPTPDNWPVVSANTPLHLTVHPKVAGRQATSKKAVVPKSPAVHPHSPIRISLTSRTHLPITFEPADAAVFKAALLVRKRAIVTITRQDGSTRNEAWDAGGFALESKLRANLLSRKSLRVTARRAAGVVSVHVSLAP